MTWAVLLELIEAEAGTDAADRIAERILIDMPGEPITRWAAATLDQGRMVATAAAQGTRAPHHPLGSGSLTTDCHCIWRRGYQGLLSVRAALSGSARSCSASLACCSRNSFSMRALCSAGESSCCFGWISSAPPGHAVPCAPRLQSVSVRRQLPSPDSLERAPSMRAAWMASVVNPVCFDKLTSVVAHPPLTPSRAVSFDTGAMAMTMTMRAMSTSSAFISFFRLGLPCVSSPSSTSPSSPSAALGPRPSMGPCLVTIRPAPTRSA